MKKTILSTFLFSMLLGAGLVAAAPVSALPEAQASEAKLVVDINHAEAQRLTELPGVGATVAERIIAYREENGPFEKLEELMNVRGIGEKTFLKLKPFVTLGDGSERDRK